MTVVSHDAVMRALHDNSHFSAFAVALTLTRAYRIPLNTANKPKFQPWEKLQHQIVR